MDAVTSIYIIERIHSNEFAISVAEHKHGFLLTYSNWKIN